MSDHGSVQYVSQYLQLQGFHEVFRVACGRILVFDGIGQVFYSRSLLRIWQLCILFSPLSSEGSWKSGFVED